METLDGGNPAKSLLLAMNANNALDKDHDIYLGVIDTTVKQTSNGPQGYSKVYKITAGDPSRGSLLLDAAEGPEVGARVQVRSSIFRPAEQILTCQRIASLSPLQALKNKRPSHHRPIK